MGIFKALRNMRSKEERQARTYEDLVKDMGTFYQGCESAVLTNQDGLLTLKETVGDKEISYFLDKEISYFLNRASSQYTLKLQCEQGLPGVSFLGGPVDYVLYYLTKDTDRACIVAHRSDSNEEVTVSPKQSSLSFWSEIEGLSGAGMDQLRRLSRL